MPAATRDFDRGVFRKPISIGAQPRLRGRIRWASVRAHADAPTTRSKLGLLCYEVMFGLVAWVSPLSVAHSPCTTTACATAHARRPALTFSTRSLNHDGN